ncbi:MULTISPECIES: VOC family protein [unclassified Caulobacter]|jgi:catechol 2,3-dioxygenase-like lactoylglutathione lyase family enzyme|uniref:VOC family protein n=1 Tax=unclassified Caulobacter TaxID=2648921 RepID=UPI000782D65C|nr:MULTISPECIES: VOC family protein [unclassified Caulobacter]AZS19273.1 dioxygenase [Caulobacter sp. FWC26]PIB90040.1 dioxygenase [Caulobacter sp. FWC2]
MIVRMDHFTVMTDRLTETLDFYAMLGLTMGPRPDFGVGGAWLYVGDHPLLHIVETTRMPEPRRGALDHMAFFAQGFQAAAARIAAAGLTYRVIRTPRPFSFWQLFLFDPNGVEVELDFAADEAPPPDWKTRAGLGDR